MPLTSRTRRNTIVAIIIGLLLGIALLIGQAAEKDEQPAPLTPRAELEMAERRALVAKVQLAHALSQLDRCRAKVAGDGFMIGG